MCILLLSSIFDFFPHSVHNAKQSKALTLNPIRFLTITFFSSNRYCVNFYQVVVSFVHSLHVFFNICFYLNFWRILQTILASKKLLILLFLWHLVSYLLIKCLYKKNISTLWAHWFYFLFSVNILHVSSVCWNAFKSFWAQWTVCGSWMNIEYMNFPTFLISELFKTLWN